MKKEDNNKDYNLCFSSVRLISANYNYIASFYNNFKKKKRISICGQILNVSRRNRTKNIIQTVRNRLLNLKIKILPYYF